MKTCRECGIYVDESNLERHEKSHYDVNRWNFEIEVKRIIDHQHKDVNEYVLSVSQLRLAYFKYKEYKFQGWEN